MNSESSKPTTPEEIEPTSGTAPAPVWLFVLVIVLAFWGMGFLDKHGGGFDSRVYPPYGSMAEVETDQPATDNGGFAKGRIVYLDKAKCAACHMENGQGNPAVLAPPLAGSEWVLAKEPGRAIRILLNGLQGPVTVKDRQFNSAGMPPWKESLTDEDVANVLTYIRNEWGNAATEVKPEQVKAIREKTASHSSQWLSDELLKIPENE